MPIIKLLDNRNAIGSGGEARKSLQKVKNLPISYFQIEQCVSYTLLIRGLIFLISKKIDNCIGVVLEILYKKLNT